MQSNLHRNANIVPSSSVLHSLNPDNQLLEQVRTLIYWQVKKTVNLIQICYHVSSKHAQPTRIEREMRHVNQSLYVEQVSIEHIRLLLKQWWKMQIHNDWIKINKSIND